MTSIPLDFLQEPGRLAALRRTRLLDSAPSEAFDRVTRLATAMIHAPVALVSLVDADRQFFKSSAGLAEPWASQRETPLSHSFCQHTIVSREPLLISDAREHSLLCDNLAIPDLGVVAYAGIPLISSDGFVLGSFCVIDSVPREWTAAEVAILQDLAAGIMTELELHALTQAATRRAEEVDAIIETMTDGLALYDGSGTILIQNTAMRVLLGQRAAEEYPQQPFDMRGRRLNLRDAGGAPLLQSEWPVARLLQGETLSGDRAADLRLSALDGRELLINVSGSPLYDGDGSITGAVAVYRDVTERRRLEGLVVAERDRLQQVIDLLPGGVLLVDTKGGITLANRVARQVLGPAGLQRIPLAETEERPSGETLPSTRPQVELISLLRSALGGTTVQGARLGLHLHDEALGRETPFLLNVSPLYDTAGVQMGAVAVFQDISAIQELERAREEFLSSASHDLRNPLTTIRGLAQLIRRRLHRLPAPEAASLADQANRIEAETGRMARLLDELTDVMRDRLGETLHLQRRPVDVVALVRAVVDRMSQPRGQVVELETPLSGLPGLLDAERIERVVENLLSNAGKYSPGESTIHVRIDRVDGARGPEALIEVRDEGMGVPAADLPHIFERFHRAANVVGQAAGAGIGLASARQIVEHHGGTIAAQSEEGKGATFTVRVPLEPAGGV